MSSAMRCHVCSGRSDKPGRGLHLEGFVGFNWYFLAFLGRPLQCNLLGGGTRPICVPPGGGSWHMFSGSCLAWCPAVLVMPYQQEHQASLWHMVITLTLLGPNWIQLRKPMDPTGWFIRFYDLLVKNCTGSVKEWLFLLVSLSICVRLIDDCLVAPDKLQGWWWAATQLHHTKINSCVSWQNKQTLSASVHVAKTS